MKKVIINADDFGLCGAVNEGVIQAHQKGVLTSATLMANTPGFEEACDLAKENQKLGTGVHLNIVRGKPILPPEKVRSLVNGEGRFFPAALRIIGGILWGKILLEEVEREFRAQTEKILEKGIAISHFDSEKHLHSFLPLSKLVIKLGQEYKIKKIRFINESCFSPSPRRWVKSLFLFFSSALMKKKLLRSGMMITDRFYGICNSGKMTALKLRKILKNLGDGVTEIMVHPGFVREELFEVEKVVGSYYINKYREAELQALLDEGVKETIRRENIQLINFHELGNGQ